MIDQFSFVSYRFSSVIKLETKFGITLVNLSSEFVYAYASQRFFDCTSCPLRIVGKSLWVVLHFDSCFHYVLCPSLGSYYFLFVIHKLKLMYCPVFSHSPQNFVSLMILGLPFPLFWFPFFLFLGFFELEAGQIKCGKSVVYIWCLICRSS